ncbi:hypothetical protein [Paenibacillus puldeungensis]
MHIDKGLERPSRGGIPSLRESVDAANRMGGSSLNYRLEPSGGTRKFRQ